VAWEDCRFEPSCSANDIVFSSSSDGLAWNAVKRIPIDPVGSGVDHFIPGLAVDPATRGSGTHLRSPSTTTPTHRARRARASCAWDSSRRRDAGSSWSAPTALAGPLSLSDIADTSEGPMVGDYISTSFNDAGTAATAFAIGKPHTGKFREGILGAERAAAGGGTLVRRTRARR